MGQQQSSVAHTSRNLKRRLAYRGIAIAGAVFLALNSPSLLNSGFVLSLQSSFAGNGGLAEKDTTIHAGFAAVVAKVKPAVVDIRARTLDEDEISAHNPHRAIPQARTPGSAFRESKPHYTTSEGSGFLISADGYVVTNNHVIAGSATAEVTTDRGEVYRARVVGADPTTDLALLKISGRGDFPHVEFADALPRIGDWVVAVGNPFGLGGTVTAGIVSARGRDLKSNTYQDLLQIDAPVNRGNSGGPSFDLDGKVVGINSIIISPSGGSVGIAFAIPASTAKRIIAQLEEKGSVTRGWLGIQFQSVSPEIADSLGVADPSGILIADVSSDGPAAAAGIAVGDLIRSMNGEAVQDAHDFSRLMDEAAPGSKAVLGLVRDGRETSVVAVVGNVPTVEKARLDVGVDKTSNDGDRQLGLLLAPAELSGVHGVTIVGIDPGGLAAARGLSPGDVIVDVESREVGAPAEVYSLFDQAQRVGKKAILLRVRTGDITHFVALPIG